MQHLKWVWQSASGERWKLIVAYSLYAVLPLMFLINPKISSELIDRGIEGGETNLIVPLALAIGYAVNVVIRVVLLRGIITMPLPAGRIALCAVLSGAAAAAVLLRTGVWTELLMLVAIEGFYLWIDREKLGLLTARLKARMK